MRVMAISAAHPCVAELLSEQYRLRARIFSQRLGWDVTVSDDMERDRFDELRPTYIMALTADGSLAGCARLLPALGPTMVADVFASLLPNGRLNAHAAMVESSRFCVDTGLAGEKSKGFVHEATLTLFAGITEWCLANGFAEIVTVTDLRFERLLSRVGWALQRLSAPQTFGVTTAVAGILAADAETFSRLRPSRYHSDISTVSNAA